MMNITLIAAVGKNLELGKDNNLIWKIPEDMKFFRDNTDGRTIIMGINTFNSLPGILPNRKHIVLTHRDIELNKDIVVVHSLDELFSYIKKIDGEVVVIGGSMVYSIMIEYANKILLTEINANSDADVYFPYIDNLVWNREVISQHKYNDLEYEHVVYTRKRVKN